MSGKSEDRSGQTPGGSAAPSSSSPNFGIDQSKAGSGHGSNAAGTFPGGRSTREADLNALERELTRAKFANDLARLRSPHNIAEFTARGDAVFPSAISPKYSRESAGKARMHTCLDQYNANKANNGNGGMRWIERGGGYYSECNRRLEG